MIEMLLQLGWIILKILAVVVPLLLAVAYLTYAERKVIGYMQDRIGPNRVGFRGLLQPIADGMKLAFKEIIVPTASIPFCRGAYPCNGACLGCLGCCPF